MDIEIAIVIAGVMIFVGAIIAGGQIYSGLVKLANAIRKE
jgi:phosphate/sulfate permease